MIGFHASHKDIKILEKWGASTIQIFIRNKIKFNSKLYDMDYDELKKSNLKIFSHAQYILNFTKKTINNKLNKAVIMSIVDELKFHNKINGKGVVIHLGSLKKNTSFKESFPNILAYLYTIIKIAKPKKGNNIYIENRALAGTLALTDINQMIDLWEYIKNSKIKQNISFCYDTCHDFISIQKKAYSYNTTITDNLKYLLKKKVPIGIVHLNDSKSKTKDEHDDIFEGYINQNELVGIINICKKNKIPMVIERPKNEKMLNNVKKFI